MRTLTPFQPRRWKRDLMPWPVDSFWNRIFDFNEDGPEDWTPSMDLIEKPDAYFVKLEIPGIEPKDIHVTLDGRELTIKGERVKEETKEADNFRVCERSYGSFLRTLTLPLPADDGHVDAHAENGLLTIKIKKAKEAKPTHIKIKST